MPVLLDQILEFLVYFTLNILFVIIISPFFMTLIKKVKAYVQRRRGPPLLQGYYNLIKLMQKERLYSSTSSIVSRVTPTLNLVIMIVAILAVPVVFVPKYLGDFGNIVFFLYLIALTKFFLAISGLDAGSTFGGMGSSREMTVVAIFEPIMVIVFAALAFTFGTVDIHVMFSHSIKCSNDFLGFYQLTGIAPDCNRLFIILLPIVISLFVMLIVETARIPVDNPETHLELTMIHEAMVLEQSGPNLAMLDLSYGIKQTLLLALLVNILFPVGLSIEMTIPSLIIGMIAFLVKGSILSFVIALFESSVAKLRLLRLPGLFSVAFFLPLISIALAILT